MQRPRCAHLSSPEMHVPGARMSRRTHLLAPKDARVQHGVRVDGGDTCLMLSKTSVTGVPLPWKPMQGVLSSQTPILGILFSQMSTLGLLTPQEPMNMSGQLGENLQQGGKANQEDASHPELAQLSSIL